MKIPHRRQFLHLAAGAVALPAASRIARAQTYPSRPVRLIVGFAPGGSADIVARLVGQQLADKLGQPFVVENRPGAGTNIGTEAALKAAADGYTLLLVTTANAINATLYEKLNFNFIRDIAPVAGLVREPNAMVVHPAVPARSVAEFIAYAKANPGKVTMASAGNGAPSHISGELFKMMTGVNLVHVPYRGGGPALIDLVGGQVQVYFAPMLATMEYIKAGTLRALAVTTKERSETLPGVPAVDEFVPGYEASQWYGIGAPRGISAEIVDKLNRAANTGIADPKLNSRFADAGTMVLTGSPADFGKLIADETEKWGKVIRAANIKAE
jgi:tripartite-type tricarboxylate transporter receptor subunit TctC